MSELKSILPQIPETVSHIYAYHKASGDAEPERGYLGASIIGHPCDRYLWYMFRNCVNRNFDGRMYRLFERGDLEEARFIVELRAIGCEVADRDAEGGQVAVYALGGHLSGHLDAAALGIIEAPKTWHVCEFKTHNDKSFNETKKNGVKKAKPQHYAQMQIYMGRTGMTRTLYLFVNKDTDEVWSERVEYSAADYNALIERAERIIKATKPTERCAQRSDSFACKFCDAHGLCWGLSDRAVPIPSRGCKSCCHSTPEIDQDSTAARWSCARFKNNSLTAEELARGCEKHLLLPGLVSFAEPVDAGQDWIEFANADGTRWRHGCGEGLWSTEELMRTPGPLVCKRVTQIKEVFAGTVTSTSSNLIEEYSPGDNEVLWHGPVAGVGEALDGLGLGDRASMQPTRIGESGDIQTTEFIDEDPDGRDILIVINTKAGEAGILEGKK